MSGFDSGGIVSGFDSLFGPTGAYRHNGDRDLLASLGLVTDGFRREPTDLGTVVLGNATVRVEVTARPAQFWTFTVTRSSDECYRVETGSGGFSTYWPAVERLAEEGVVKFADRRMFEVKRLGDDS